MRDPLLCRLGRQYRSAIMLLQKPASDRINLSHDCSGLDEMRDALETAPVSHNLAAVHRRLKKGQLMSGRHRHDDSCAEPAVHQLGGHVDAVSMPSVVVNGA